MSAITTLGKEFGDVCTSLSRSLEDGRFEPKEARDMVGELRDVERVAREAREGLEEFAGQQFIGGKWVSVPGKARN